MKTLNVTEETLKRFRADKIKAQARLVAVLTDDEFLSQVLQDHEILRWK